MANGLSTSRYNLNTSRYPKVYLISSYLLYNLRYFPYHFNNFSCISFVSYIGTEVLLKHPIFKGRHIKAKFKWRLLFYSPQLAEYF
jgi:hypothetical protein